MVTVKDLSKKTRDSIIKSITTSDNVSIGQKVTEQEAEKNLDTSTSTTLTAIQSLNNMYINKIGSQLYNAFVMKIKETLEKPPIEVGFVFNFIGNFQMIFKMALINNILIQSYSLKNKTNLFFMVNYPDKFEKLLTDNKIVFMKKQAIIIGTVYPIPGGLNKILSIIPDVDIIINNASGLLVIVPLNENNINISVLSIKKLMGI